LNRGRADCALPAETASVLNRCHGDRSHQEAKNMKLESVESAITVQSSDIDLGEALPRHAEEGILRVASKYFGRLVTGSAHFSKEGHNFRCSVNMQMGALKMMSAEAQNKDIYTRSTRRWTRSPSNCGAPSANCGGRHSWIEGGGTILVEGPPSTLTRRRCGRQHLPIRHDSRSAAPPFIRPGGASWMC
jgi:hypothetical protein